MTEVYIVLGVLVVVFFVVMFILPQIKYNKAKKILSEYSSFKECKKEYYDFTLENEEIKLFIRIVDIPKNSMITINSKDTWVLSWGGSSKDLGRAYPNKKYLDEIKQFLKHDYKTEKQSLKVVLINSRTEKVVRYLNESELAVVTFNDTVYGCKVMELEKIEEQLKILGINK